MDRSALLGELLKKKKGAAEGSPMQRAQEREAHLRQRRLSLTPDDKESLLRSEDKVVGAALSLHVIHDVPLDELDTRLAAWGVEPGLRRKTLATIQSKTSALRQPKFDEPVTPAKAADPYAKMLAMGVPKGAVRARMLRDGKTEAEADKIAPVDKVAAPAKTPVKKVQKTPARKVKTVHWKKLEVDASRTVWASADEKMLDGDDLALLEELFATKPAAAKTKDDESLKKFSLIGDPRRASNVAIGLTYFSRRFGEDDAALCRAVLCLDDRMDGPRLRAVLGLLPTTDELQAVRAFDGDKRLLARPERFFLATCRFTDLKARLQVGLFRSEFDEIAREARSAVRSVQVACDLVKSQDGLPVVLRTLLKLGNQLNKGHPSGEATAIAVASLDRFCTTRANDGTSLVEYATALFAKKDQLHHFDFVDKLPHLDDAARNADPELTSASHTKLVTQLAKTKQELQRARVQLAKLDSKARDAEQALMGSCDKRAKPARVDAQVLVDRAVVARFVLVADKCCRAADATVGSLGAKLKRLEASKKELRDYFGEPATADIRELFAALDVFVRQVRAARDNHVRRAAAKARLEREQQLKQARKLERSVSEPAVASRDSRDPPVKAAARKSGGVAVQLKRPASSDRDSSTLKLNISKCRTAYNQKESKKREFERYMAETIHEHGDDNDSFSSPVSVPSPLSVPSPRSPLRLTTKTNIRQLRDESPPKPAKPVKKSPKQRLVPKPPQGPPPDYVKKEPQQCLAPKPPPGPPPEHASKQPQQRLAPMVPPQEPPPGYANKQPRQPKATKPPQRPPTAVPRATVAAKSGAKENAKSAAKDTTRVAKDNTKSGAKENSRPRRRHSISSTWWSSKIFT